MHLSRVSSIARREPVMLYVSRPLSWSNKGYLKLVKCRVLHLDSSGVVQTNLETDPISIEVAVVRQRARRVEVRANQVEEQLQELIRTLPKSNSNGAITDLSSTEIVARKRLEWDQTKDDEVFVKTTRDGGVHRNGKRREKAVDLADDFVGMTSSPFARDNKDKLLTADEEKELAAKIRRMVEIHSLRKEFKKIHDRSPSWSELARMLQRDAVQLQKEYQEGIDAKHMMLSRNMRLVISVATKLRPRGRPLQEVIADGSAGLLRAIEKFDPDKGYKLSTYAHWWIRQFISRGATEGSRVITVPLSVSETFTKLMRAQDNYRRQHGHPPTEEELMRRLGLSKKRLKAIKNAYRQFVSLDAPIHHDEGINRSDIVEDRRALTPEESYAKTTMKQDLELIVATLPPKEATILRLRYGLDDGRERTLEEIGQLFNVTRERVRQIEAKALRKLRQRSGNLKEYLQPIESGLRRTPASANLKHS